MKRQLVAVLLISLSLVLGTAWVAVAKLPAGYSHTRGLYIYWDQPTDELNPPALPVAGGFWRYNWSDLETANDDYQWGKITNWVQAEQARGKLAGIGFSFFNRYTGEGADRGLQIPQWLHSSYPGDVAWLNTRLPGQNWYLPNYWSNNLRNHYEDFINDFAQYLKDNPAIASQVAWVSMGVGLEGETQPACRWGCPGEEPNWYYYREDRAKRSADWIEFVNWCSRTYKQAFASKGLNTPIFLDIGPTFEGGAAERGEFSGYAVTQGVGLRNNGLKMDRENGVIYEPMKQYWNSVPTAWETYGTPGWLDSRAAVFWGLLCGLAKHPDNFTVDRILVGTEDYLPLLQFAADYSGVTLANTPGVWVGLRHTEQAAGESGNSSFWLTQKEGDAAYTQAVFNTGADRRYIFDVPNGTYEVELHFAEIYHTTSERIFDILIEGQIVADNFNLVAAAGGARRSVVRTFSKNVSDGQLEVRLTPDWGAGSRDHPVVSAIKVTGPGYTRRLNCGGNTYRDSGGNDWTYDREYVAGGFGYIGGSTYYDGGAEITNSADDYLYQSQRVMTGASQSMGRFARRTDYASGNRYMRFDVDGGYVYASPTQVTIQVTYYDTGSDAWELRYDASGDTNKLARRVQKGNSGLWKQEEFYITDAYFGNRQPNSTDFSIDALTDGDEFISFVHVTKGGGGPSTATINGSVDLQRPGKPAPDPSWQVQLSVRVGSTDYSTSTDQWGKFTLAGLTPGTYDIRVKNAHTLSRLKNGVTLVAGTNSVDVGTLLEGDANNDDVVNSSDFLLLRGSYFKSVGQPGFVDGADFNEDDIVNSSDFLLLRGNYFKSGPVTSSQAYEEATETSLETQTADTVSISIQPASTAVRVGDEFDLDVRVDAGATGVAAADVFINFDPDELEVLEIADGQPLTMLAKLYDNGAGTVDIGAGTLGTPATGSFVLAKLHLRAKASTQGNLTLVAFSLTAPRQTVVKDADDHNILGTSSNGTIRIDTGAGAHSIYLPSISSQ